MDAKTAWYLFETTGNIEAYMLYQELAAGGQAGHGSPRAPMKPYTSNRKQTGAGGAGDVPSPFSVKM